MKRKAMYGVSILVVSALAAVSFFMAPGFVCGADDSGPAESISKAEGAAASRTETNKSISGTEADKNTYYGYNAGTDNTGQEVSFYGVGAGWRNTGNYSTFIGFTTGCINTQTYNTFVGYSAGYTDVEDGDDLYNTGQHGTFIGAKAGANGNSGNYGTFIGAEAGVGGNSGDANTFVGRRAGYKNTSGESNTFLGAYSGTFNTEGDRNTFMGRAAGYRNTTGDYNTYVGRYAGYRFSTGAYNTFLGCEAGYNPDEANVSFGSNNTFIGNRAGYSTKSGFQNTFIGDGAGHDNTDGDYNTFIGRSAGSNNTTGSRNVFIGYRAGFFNETASDKLCIDNTDTYYPLIWGNFEAGDRRVIIYGGFRAMALYTSSDRRLKKDIKPLASSLDKISGLQGVSYEWKRNDYPDMGMMEGKQIGLVAQDVEQVLPELVSEDKDGYKAVSYTKLTAVLVEAVKELKAENQRQKELLEEQLQKQQAEIEELRTIIKDLKS